MKLTIVLPMIVSAFLLSGEPVFAQHDNCPVLIKKTASDAPDHCPDLGKNRDLVRESQQYLKDNSLSVGQADPLAHPSIIRGKYSKENYARRHYFGGDIGRITNDSPPQKAHDVRYLSLPIETIEDIEFAKAEAADLEAKGEAGAKMASLLRTRIDNAMDGLFGQKLTDTKFKCISVAEDLRKNAWKCQERELYDMAEKLNERVLAIYQKEVGSVPKTAGVMADLGKLADVQNHQEEAQDWYARALHIYNNFPTAASAERASFLENFAGFLSRKRQTKFSNDLYQEAAEVREKLANVTAKE